MPVTVKLSSRMSVVKESAIIRVAQAARELKAQGRDVVSLSIGVPGFTPPQAVYDAARDAVANDTGDYLPGRGQPSLIEAFRAFLAARGFSYETNRLAAQIGGKGALFNLLLALLDDGDKVAIPAPYWTSYPEMVKLAGGEPVIIPASAAQNYKITPEQLRRTLEQGVRLFLFNNPSNPTGMLYDKTETAALAAVLAEFPQTTIISDDIYDKLVFTGGIAPHILHTQPQLEDRTIIVQSISKTYGMPGWRVGLVAGPKNVVDALLTLTSQSFTNIPGVVMAAAEAALKLDDSYLQTQLTRLKHQRDLTLAALQECGLPCPTPQGAFYAFPQITPCLGKTTPKGTKLTDDETFCTALLEEANVALVPGSAFGDPHAVRISYAGKEEALQTGLTRLKEWLKSLDA